MSCLMLVKTVLPILVSEASSRYANKLTGYGGEYDGCFQAISNQIGLFQRRTIYLSSFASWPWSVFGRPN